MTNKLSDAIEQAGENFQPDAMPDYDQRMASGEFKSLTQEQIRDIYHREAVEAEHDEELQNSYDRINQMEEAESDHGD